MTDLYQQVADAVGLPRQQVKSLLYQYMWSNGVVFSVEEMTKEVKHMLAVGAALEKVLNNEE